MSGPADRQSWRPSASLVTLETRARLFARIRCFFAERKVLEVDTPLLAPAASTAPMLQSIGLRCTDRDCFLQTSPESALKRLLAAYPVPCYQMGKVFRDGELGRRHSPEFTLLEWYRPGLSFQSLIDEVAALVGDVLEIHAVRQRSYRDVFHAATALDPHLASVNELVAVARQALGVDFDATDRDFWLNLLFSHLVEPGLGQDCLEFIDGFPACQAAQATVEPDSRGELVARRFELFVDGVELANGYQELRDADELERRMQADVQRRKSAGLAEVPVDELLLAALRHGLPDCVGVALGVDRLLMLLQRASTLAEVTPFGADWRR